MIDALGSAPPCLATLIISMAEMFAAGPMPDWFSGKAFVWLQFALATPVVSGWLAILSARMGFLRKSAG